MSDSTPLPTQVDAASAVHVNHANGVDVKYAEWTEQRHGYEEKHTLIINPAAEFSDTLGVLMTTELGTATREPFAFRISLIARDGKVGSMETLRDYDAYSGLSGSTREDKVAPIIERETDQKPFSGRVNSVHAVKGDDDTLFMSEWVKKTSANLVSAIKDSPLIAEDETIRDAVAQTMMDLSHFKRMNKSEAVSAITNESQAKLR